MKHAALAAALAAAGHASAADSFIFTLDTHASSLLLAPDFSVATQGTLIGNHDPVSNPSGTQIRPGLFGGSGNNPIPATIDLSMSGRDTTHPTGRFRFDADTSAGLFTIAALEADLLGGASLDTPLTLGLLYQTFRTIAPNSLYLGGVRLPLPLGNASISALSFTQSAPAPGILLPADAPGTFTFATILPVTLTASASALAQTFDLPEAPALLPISGILDTTTTPPTITVSFEAAFDQEVPADIIAQIPPIEGQALDLPTIIPPGQTAHLLMSLTVGSIHAGVSTSATLVADGTPHCAADLNNDGMVDRFDYLDFVAAFEQGLPAADFNLDRFVDFFDYADFIDAFTGPCST